jgi:hypothetical protein
MRRFGWVTSSVLDVRGRATAMSFLVAGCGASATGGSTGNPVPDPGRTGDAAPNVSPSEAATGQPASVRGGGNGDDDSGGSTSDAGQVFGEGGSHDPTTGEGGSHVPTTDEGGSHVPTSGDGGHSPDSAVSQGGGVPTTPSVPVFSSCRFHFGTLDSVAKGTSGLAGQVDLFTPGWIGQSDSFDMKGVCDEIKPGAALAGAIPAMVSYIIAFTARRDVGLQDCNVSGTTNLCKYGATYIRGHRQRILDQYKMYAQGFAQNCGTQHPLIWLMEPDYYQYSTGGDAMALTPTEAGALMTDMVAQVKQYLPNAIFSLDISPWIPNNGAQWYPNFQLSDFTFINTSGGGTDAANTKIRAANAMTWAGVHGVTGKPILADTGYGAAGASAGFDAPWNVAANINARMADGVVGITQYNPNQSNQNWPQGITSIRSALQTPSPCP